MFRVLVLPTLIILPLAGCSRQEPDDLSLSPRIDTKVLVESLGEAIDSPTKSWVAFSHGTFVILMKPEQDLAAQASRMLKDFGPARPGGPSGDFSVIHLDRIEGWAISYDHPDILTLVLPHEVEAGAPDHVIGLFGRSKRDFDTTRLEVVHVEDKRGTREDL